MDRPTQTVDEFSKLEMNFGVIADMGQTMAYL